MSKSQRKTMAARRQGPGPWRFSVWLLSLLACTALAVYLRHDPEQWPVLSAVQYFPLLVLLTPMGMLALIMWPLGGAWRWLGGVPALIVLGPIMGLCLGLGDSGSARVRFMTYNVKSMIASNHQGGVQQAALEVWRQDPDLLVMQDASDVINWKTDRPEQYKLLMGDRQVFEFGQYVIASRNPMRDCKPGFLRYGGGQHSFLHCMVTLHGREVNVVTVHFLTPREGLNALRFERLRGRSEWRDNLGERLAQTTLLAAYLRDLKGPVILAGDLNAPEQSRIVQELLDTGLRDAFHVGGLGWGYTHGHSLIKGLSFNRIDHILVSEDIGVVRAFRGGKDGSEHRPVVADLALQRD